MAAWLLAVVTAAAAIVMHRNVWFVAGPFLVLWLVAPAVALWTSQPQQHAAEQAAESPEDKRAIRLTARRTWRFFETFVTEDTHFLPPDGFQEDPAPVVAHRTSPTNIGLYLLSTVSANDFGWLGTSGHGRAPRGHVCDHPADGTLPGPPLQLV